MLERGIARLNITLRWPLQVFRDLEKSPAAVPGRQEQAEQDSPISEAWTETGEILRNMETLTRLRLWFDHSEPSTWALVNEKALLDPLIAKLSKTTADITIILPKLHPLHEDEDRHFLENTHIGIFRLYRMVRQRWHSSEDDTGAVQVIYKPDFPFSIDVFDDRSQEEAEAWERQAWKNGSNVEATVENLRPENNHVP